MQSKMLHHDLYKDVNSVTRYFCSVLVLLWPKIKISSVLVQVTLRLYWKLWTLNFEAKMCSLNNSFISPVFNDYKVRSRLGSSMIGACEDLKTSSVSVGIKTESCSLLWLWTTLVMSSLFSNVTLNQKEK